MRKHINTNQLIIAVSSLSETYTVTRPIFTYHEYKALGAISTAFVHTPIALFAAIAAITTLDIDKRFSVIAALFSLLNAGLV